MTPKKKAKDLYNKMLYQIKYNTQPSTVETVAKKCAIIAIENEYVSLREQIFNLRSCRVIESEKVYLYKIQELIDEEKEVKQQILGL